MTTYERRMAFRAAAQAIPSISEHMRMTAQGNGNPSAVPSSLTEAVRRLSAEGYGRVSGDASTPASQQPPDLPTQLGVTAADNPDRLIIACKKLSMAKYGKINEGSGRLPGAG